MFFRNVGIHDSNMNIHWCRNLKFRNRLINLRFIDSIHLKILVTKSPYFLTSRRLLKRCQDCGFTGIWTFIFMVKHGGSKLLWNVGTQQHNYMTLHSRRLLPSSHHIKALPTYLPLWDTWLNRSDHCTSQPAMPWLAWLLLRCLRSVRTVFLRVLLSSAVTITTPMFHTQSFTGICPWCNVILATVSAIKQQARVPHPKTADNGKENSVFGNVNPLCTLYM
jgi:hypothetical protein